MSPLKAVGRSLKQLAWLRSQFGGLLREQRLWLFGAASMMAAEITFLILAPWPIKYLFDAYLIPKDDVTVPFVPRSLREDHPNLFVALLAGSLLALSAGAALTGFYRSVWSATAGQRMVFKLRKRLYLHLQQLPMAFHHRQRFGDLLLRLTGDIPALRDILSESLLELVGRLVMALVMLVILCIRDLPLALISVGVLLAVVVLSRFFSRRITGTVRKQRKKEAQLANLTGEGLRGVALVKALGQEKEVVRWFARHNRSSLRAGVKGTRLQASLSGWAEVVFGGGLALVLAFGAYRVANTGDLYEGDLLIFLSYVRSLHKPLRKISRMTARIGKAKACGERVVEVLNEKIEDDVRGGSHELARLREEIELDGVGFRYPDGHEALRDVHLRFAKGQAVGLVGRNGAGKSTLLHLLLSFFDPTRGQVRFDGRDARDCTLRSLRRQFSFVPQQTFLFGNCVRDNLALVAPEADDAAMEQALRRVGADFLFEARDGLDTSLQEEAANLSGGQRQKIALAAAQLSDAPAMILDEPTAHIDHASRAPVLAWIRDAAADRAVIVVSHDPDLLARLDAVAFLEGGEVVGFAPHGELLERDARYRALFAEPWQPSEVGP